MFATAQLNAELVTFDTTAGGTTSGSVFSSTQSVSAANGVSFDATLNVTASDGSISRTADGLGINNLKISNGQYFTYSMMVSNVSGGSVTFDGFKSFSHANGTGSTTGTLSLTNSTANGFASFNGQFGQTDFAGTSPVVFSAIADPGKSNKFYAVGVAAGFNTTAIPEPTTLLMFGFVLPIVLARRKSS